VTAAADSTTLDVGAAQARAFHALIARLERDGAGPSGYEALRRRLIQYFRLHLPEQADDLADIALDRLGRKLDEGTPIEQLRRYALGIARMVRHEAYARLAQTERALANPSVRELGSADTQHTIAIEAMAAALDACLDKLGIVGTELILDYYGDEASTRIAQRKALAMRHRISPNALRNRALRLREVLQRCVHERLDGGSPA
jgi:hypothetical protein